MSRALTVVRLSKIVEAVLAELGLTLNQYRMLTFIEHGAPPIAELGRRLAMKRPNVTKLIDGLVERGLALRARNSEDRRRVDLSVTDSAEALLLEAEKRCDAVLDYLADRSGDSRVLLGGLDSWIGVLDDIAADLFRDGNLEAGR
jgi:DNA-binding MarR family transcriptional regulator